MTDRNPGRDRGSTTGVRSLVLVAIGLLLLVAGCVGTGSDETSDAEPDTALDERLEQQSLDAGTLLEQLGQNQTQARDSDNDSLPDVVENFVYGSDPHDASTTGSGVPDGWLAEHGYDPTDPGVASEPAAVPSPGQLPPAYEGTWPDKYAWTLQDAYRHGIPEGWTTTADGVWDNGIDPRNVSYRDGGIPYAWLVHHGIETLDESVEQATLGDDELNVRDNYEHDTNPRAEDTDADGLPDAAEVQQHGTDPTAFSTAGIDVADGWLVDHGYDPTDPRVGSQRTTGKGLTVAETWAYNVDRFGLEAALRGEGLDPGRVSTLGTGLPDGWLVEHGLDPLDGSLPDETVERASDHDRARNLTEAPEGLDPIPDLALTVREHYAYNRPEDWREGRDGVWDGGLSPSEPDADGDGLPSVLEIRGWYAKRALDVGPEPDREWYHATSDPLNADTDGDGLADGEEHDGRLLRNGTLHVFQPSDPRNADTAFSGLSDGEKVLGLGVVRELEDEELQSIEDVPSNADRVVEPLLEPAKRDSAGSFLADGEEFSYWEEAAQAVGNRSYQDQFDTRHPDYASWFNDLEAFGGVTLSQDEIAEQLGPLGDADQDDLANVVDPDSNNDGILDGWAVDPTKLSRANAFPHADAGPRETIGTAWIDPANPDTDGDGLPDAWELEHGRFLTDDGRWDLTPAAWSSDGDEDSDADENLNDDTVTWYTFEGEESNERTFEYTNLREYESGTDPRRSDPNGQGVTQGWTFFWTVRYPSMVQGDEVGNHHPSLDEVNKLVKRLKGDQISEAVGDTVKRVEGTDQIVPYRRVVDLNSMEEQPSLIEAWSEEVVEEDQQCEGYPDDPCEVLDEGGGTASKPLVILEGTYEHTYARDQEFGLNPYLEDTSGNGVSDAWLMLYGQLLNGEVVEHGERKGCDQVDPLDPTPPQHVDPTGDGRSLKDAYTDPYPPRGRDLVEGAFTSDPCLTDTDQGGLRDADDTSENGRNPWKPTDDVVGSGEDQDGDGLVDRYEVTCVGSNPGQIDTDLDGILDGEDLSGADLSDKFLRWGIGHVVDDQGEATFFGAWGNTPIQQDSRGCDRRPPNTDPLIRDSEIDGIPDGWARAYKVPPPQEGLQDAYTCNRPAWWSEADLGVWWWGLDPRSEADGCPADLDDDGLLDRSGEDPIPAADPTNDFTQRREGTPVPADVHPRDALQDTTLDTSQRVQIAQTWGKCAGRISCISDWDDENPARAPVEVNLDEEETDDRIRKGEPFWVNGTLEMCPDNGDAGCEPAPRRTVGVYLPDVADPIGTSFTEPVNGSFEMPLGLAFTDEAGAFAIEACVCEDDRSVTIPEDGMVALSRDRGQVSWSIATEEVTAGPTALNVSAYASVPVPGEDHPHYIEVDLDVDGETETVHATQRNATALEVVAKTDTELSVSTTPASSVEWTPGPPSATVAVDLTDATGDPVPGKDIIVQVQGSAIEETVETDEDGRASTPVALPNGTGEVSIHAQFEPGDANSDLFDGSQANTSLVLQQRNQVEIELSSESVDIGDDLEVDVTVTTPAGDPVPSGRMVHASLSGSKPGVTGRSLETDTDADGEAHLEFDTTGMEPDSRTLTVSVEATDRWTSAEASRTVHVVTGTRLDISPPDVVRRGEKTTVTGQLATTDGDPIPDENVTMTLQGRELAKNTTEPEGTFQASLTVPEDAEVGLQDLTASFEGTVTHDEASASVPVRVVVPTDLAVPTVRTTPGDAVAIEGTLLRDGDRPLAGEHVSLHIHDERVDRVLTDDDGSFQATYQVPANATFGARHGKATYDGSRNGTYDATTVPVELLVQMETTLEADSPTELTRGNDTWSGRLTVQDGTPVAQAPVNVKVPDGPDRTEHTDEEGRFETSFAIGEGPAPGPVTLRASFPGNETLRAAEATAHPELTVTPQLRTRVPGDAGRSTNLTVEATVLDDVDRPVPEGTLAVQAFGTQRQVSVGPDGGATVSVPVPAEQPLGPSEVRVSVPGDAAGLRPVSTIRTVEVKEGTVLEMGELPNDAEPGEPIEVTVTLSDSQGNPLASQPVAVRVDGVAATAVAETGPDGTAAVTLPAPDRDAGVHARYPGSDVYASAEDATTPLGVHAAETTETTWPWAPLLAGTALGGLAVAGVLVYRRRRRATGEVKPMLEEAEERIEAGEPWARVIQDTYERLSAYLSNRGFEERPTESPREFVQALARTVEVPKHAAIALVHLYEEAAYGDDEPAPDQAEQARAELRSIIETIEEQLRSVEEARDGGR